MKTVRQRILEYIIQKRWVASLEISRVFHMTPANARYHLAILEEQGLVAAFDRKLKAGKGRPSRLFHLSYQLSGQNIELLSSVLLETIQKGLESTDCSRRLGAIGTAMSNRMARSEDLDFDPNSPVASLSNKLSRTVRILNKNHYDSRWEARSGKPQIILGNCPYLPLVKEFPELCVMDSQILTGLLHIPTTQTQKMTFDVNGIQLCRFEIG